LEPQLSADPLGPLAQAHQPEMSVGRREGAVWRKTAAVVVNPTDEPPRSAFGPELDGNLAGSGVL
jgi:hypothetical protein